MISLIVARSKNNVIGKDGHIPWAIKGEMKQFKELTTNNIVVMGRKTYEEIGKPLPNRMNVVISKTKNYKADNLITLTSLKEAIEMYNDYDIFIAGGYNLYKEVLPIVDIMYITEIDLEVDGDIFFPIFDEQLFDIEILEEVHGDIKYLRKKYIRKKG